METNLNQWWNKDGPEAAKAAISMITVINQAQVGLHHDNLRYLRMYENRDYFTTAVSNYMIKAYSQVRRYSHNLKSSQVNMNVAKSAIDTLTSKIGKERVRPKYLTTGARIDRRERISKLNQWLFGMFDKTGLYHWNKSVFRSGCIFGKSGVKSYVGKDEKGNLCVKSEPVWMPEIIVDPYDAYYGKPQCLYQQKFVTKDLLLSKEEFQGKRAQTAIRNATLVSNTLQNSAHNTIVVWEAWRLACEGKPGRHILFTDAGLLSEDTWDDQDFSIDFFEFTQSPIGFYGLGVCEELIPIQVELNRVANHIRDSLILCSNPRTWVQAGSNVTKNLSNRIGGIYSYVGQPPVTEAPPVVSPDTWRQLQILWDRAYELVGLSQMSASGRNTLGASASGEAIREYVDVETDRFAELQQNWEDFHVRIAKRYHTMARKIVKRQGHYKIQSYDEDTVMELDFKDIDVEDDAYEIQCFPSSALPSLPGPRLARIKEWKDEGYIDADQARALQNIPDLKSQTQYLIAPRKVVEQALEQMAFQPIPKDGKYIKVIVEPYMNLELAMIMGTQMYNYLLLNLPQDTKEEISDREERLDLIRGWIDETDTLIKERVAQEQAAAMPPQQGAPMAAAAPTGQPGMPPTALTGDLGMST